MIIEHKSSQKCEEVLYSRRYYCIKNHVEINSVSKTRTIFSENQLEVVIKILCAFYSAQSQFIIGKVETSLFSKKWGL